MRYRKIIELSAAGIGALRIASLLNVAPATVLAVRRREPVALEIERQRMATLCRDGARLSAESIVEDMLDEKRLKKMSTKDKALVTAILTDKAELLSGGPTQRIRIEDGEPGHEALLEYMHGLSDGFRAGNVAAKGSAAVGGGAGAGIGNGVAPQASGDLGSVIEGEFTEASDDMKSSGSATEGQQNGGLPCA